MSAHNMIYDCVTERMAMRALIDLKGGSADILPRLQTLGLPDPSPARAGTAGMTQVLRPAPAHWLVHAPLAQEESLLQALSARPLAPDTLIVPVSDAHAWFSVRGRDARELLSIGCPLDLHPGAFPDDGATFTEVFGLKTLLLAQGDGFDLAIERSYAPLVADWFARIQGGS